MAFCVQLCLRIFSVHIFLCFHFTRPLKTNFTFVRSVERNSSMKLKISDSSNPHCKLKWEELCVIFLLLVSRDKSQEFSLFLSTFVWFLRWIQTENDGLLWETIKLNCLVLYTHNKITWKPHNWNWKLTKQITNISQKWICISIQFHANECGWHCYASPNFGGKKQNCSW